MKNSLRSHSYGKNFSVAMAVQNKAVKDHGLFNS
ncbi:MAG: hypothetical protein ACI92C_001958, partial [Neolewinella sp.]